MTTEFTWCWHVHHDVLLEPLTAPVEARQAEIRKKPAHEVETRLRLFRPVSQPKRLPARYDEAWRAYREAWRAYGEAGRAYREAWRAYGEAGRAYGEAERAYGEAGRIAKPEIEQLHSEECPDCPWDGRQLVFTR